MIFLSWDDLSSFSPTLSSRRPHERNRSSVEDQQPSRCVRGKVKQRPEIQKIFEHFLDSHLCGNDNVIRTIRRVLIFVPNGTNTLSISVWTSTELVAHWPFGASLHRWRSQNQKWIKLLRLWMRHLLQSKAMSARKDVDKTFSLFYKRIH